jgi:outer membrane receptor protein involved in Fe transport
VGRQYLDNTEDNRAEATLRYVPGYQHRVIPGHSTLNASATLDFGAVAGTHGLALEMHLQNLTDERYETAGYVYYGVPYFFPAAGRNVFASLKARF